MHIVHLTEDSERAGTSCMHSAEDSGFPLTTVNDIRSIAYQYVHKTGIQNKSTVLFVEEIDYTLC